MATLLYRTNRRVSKKDRLSVIGDFDLSVASWMRPFWCLDGFEIILTRVRHGTKAAVVSLGGSIESVLKWIDLGPSLTRSMLLSSALEDLDSISCSVIG